MFSSFKRTALLLTTALCFATVSYAQADIVRDFSQIESTWGAEISPDGNTLAIGCTHESQRAVCISPLGGSIQPTLYPSPDNAKIIDFYWGSNDHVVIITDFTEQGDFTSGQEVVRLNRAVSFNARTNKTALLLKDYRQFSNTTNLVSLNRAKKKKVVMAIGTIRSSQSGQRGSRNALTSGYDYYVFDVDLDNGGARQRSTSAKSISEALFSPDGTREVTTVYDPGTKEFEIIVGRNRTIYKDDNAEFQPFSVSSYTSDGKDLIVWSAGKNVSGYGRGVWKMSLTDGSLERIKIGDFEVTQNSPIIDRNTNRAVGFYYTDSDLGISGQFFTDNQMSEIQDALSNALGGATVRLLSWTDDRMNFVLASESPGYPVDYYLFQREAGSLAAIGSAYQAVAQRELGPILKISYDARDGLKIPAYLTLPPGKTPQDGPFPILLLPHGGPSASDNAAYDWLSQAYAAAGYAVLQANFRGSANQGEAFRAAGFGEFGGKMITDVIDGLSWLEAQNLAEPGGACILGVSYGGYSALMASITDPGKIRCAVSINGVTDPIQQMGKYANGGRGQAEAISYWEQYMGDLYASRDQHASITPTKRVSEFSVPVLLMHGDEDTRVDFAQYEGFVKAANGASWLTTYVLKGQDHFVSTQTARQQVLEQSLAFLRANHPAWAENE